MRCQFGSDLLAGISIVTSGLLGEYLAGSLVVLMRSGGEALEAYAVRSASSVLEALARRMPSRAHRKWGGALADFPLDAVAIGDELVVLPHEICPVDGVVLDGHRSMDESFLTGEPGVEGARLGGDLGDDQRQRGAHHPGPEASGGLPLCADHARHADLGAGSAPVAADWRPARRVLHALAVAVALAAWGASGEPIRFLAVVVVATPCPLLIAIPVAIIGAISPSARRGIIIKDPAVLEAITTCRTAIFDKTGTLTYSRPELTEVIARPGLERGEILSAVASLERYSKHPLAGAALEGARAEGVPLRKVGEIREPPGAGMTATLDGRTIEVTGRKQWTARSEQAGSELPPVAGGLKFICVIDGRYAATLRFRDRPRAEGPSFIRHLGPRQGFDRVKLVTGDRESEASYMARLAGIGEVLAGQTPEQKLEIVRRETQRANTVSLDYGINDAPALAAATVGIALGQNSEIIVEAAGAVILESSLEKVDELLHIGHRLRAIALQSAVGGMALSLVGMSIAATGYLPPVAGPSPRKSSTCWRLPTSGGRR